jgi:hypothetical protein
MNAQLHTFIIDGYVIAAENLYKAYQAYVQYLREKK